MQSFHLTKESEFAFLPRLVVLMAMTILSVGFATVWFSSLITIPFLAMSVKAIGWIIFLIGAAFSASMADAYYSPPPQ